MTRTTFLATLAVSTAALSACTPNQTARITGHYEDSTAEQLEAWAGRLSFVPEYVHGQSIVVSEDAFDTTGLDMLSAILDAGAPRLYVLMSATREGENLATPALQRLRARVDAFFTTDSAVPSETRATLDGIFAKIVPVEQEAPVYMRASEIFSTVWARDWSPLAARTSEGKNVIMDLNYYADRPSDDSTPRAFSSMFLSAGAPLDRVSLPIYNEGGNFMNTSDWCFMTERVLEANSKEGPRGLYFTEEDEVASQGRISRDHRLDRDAILGLYNRFGCRQTEIFPRLPDEGTGHIDMWAKILSEDTVLMGDLGDAAIAAAASPAAEALRGGRRSAQEDQESMRTMQSFLRTRQEWFRARGFRVLVVPMPTNLYAFDPAVYQWHYDAAIRRGATPEAAAADASINASSITTRSYTNSLMVNGVLITPRYQRYDTWTVRDGSWVHEKRDYPDASLLASYESEVRQTLEGAGFQVRFVETDELIAIGGSVHCTTMQVPW